MKKLVYCINDKKSGFLNPYVSENLDVAVRDFSLAVSANPNSLIFKFPEDYELYCIGEFDTKTGLIESCKPEFIISAAETFKKKVDVID